MQNIHKLSLVFIILFVSCAPKSIIPEKDMVSIIVKIQLIDAAVQSHIFQKELFNKDSIDYYSKTIESYGYTKAQFDSSLSFYSKKPSQIDAIYDKVITDLSTLETENLAENKFYDDSVARDTIRNLWNLGSAFELPNKGDNPSIEFFIPARGLGVYTISADVLLHADDETEAPSMEAYFYFDDKSKEGRKSGLTNKLYEKNKDTTTYSIQLELRNSLVTHLKGSLFANKKTGKVIKTHASITNIKVYYKPGRLKSRAKGKFKRLIKPGEQDQ